MNGDVLIVGAGPAGTAAAFDLCTEGYSVLLLDKARFPRLKPCAGGLTMKAVNTLRYPVTEITHQVCRQLNACYGTKRTIFTSPYPVVHMTVREEFDAFNLEKAREAGAKFHQIGAIEAIEGGPGDWRVITRDTTFQGKTLIAADGANSRVRKLTRPQNPIRFAFAAEALLPEQKPFEMEMDFAVVNKGYGWIFPKKDHLNIGIYSLETRPGIKGEIQNYAAERLGRELDPKTIVGHRIPIDGKDFNQGNEDPLFIGDAAGLADPFFGEGIFNALKSGQLAAEAVIADKPFADALNEIKADLSDYHTLTRLFYNHNPKTYRLLSLPPVRAALMKGVALGWTTSATMRNCLLLPFRKPAID